MHFDGCYGSIKVKPERIIFKASVMLNRIIEKTTPMKTVNILLYFIMFYINSIYGNSAGLIIYTV